MNMPTSELNAALKQLRERLLDLTGRNRLINFKNTAGKSMQFVQGTPAILYSTLVESAGRNAIKIEGLPEPTRNQWIEQNGRLQRPDPREWASKKSIPLSFDISEPDEDEEGESFLRALLYNEDLAKHLRKIEREANLAIEETGANMLFLAMGFLEFPDQPDSDKKFIAPLICLPVNMSKREVNGQQYYSIQFTGDDVTDNLSLIEKLKRDFSLHLPTLDEEQIDVDKYFEAIKEVILNRPNFSFKNRVSLCLLSFSNMLLFRDLDPETWSQTGDESDLISHPIVRQVFEGALDTGGSGLEIAKEHDVETTEANNISIVYDADSSQHSALIDVLTHQKNLVINGPPGTGKSQTITNLIAASIAEGKKVLFIAEKLTALQVVKNRLSMVGLAPYILELHSNKTSKKKVLEELAERIAYHPRNPSNLPNLEVEIEDHRRELKEYSVLLNTISHNSLGKTVHQLMWSAEKHRSRLSGGADIVGQMIILDSGNVSSHELIRRTDSLGHLASQYKSIGGFNRGSTFWGFYPENLIPGHEVQIKNIFQAANPWVSEFNEHVKRYAKFLNLSLVGGFTIELGLQQQTSLTWLLNEVDKSLPLDRIPKIMSDGSGDVSKKCLLHFKNLVDRYKELSTIVKKHISNPNLVTFSEARELNGFRESAYSLGVRLGHLGHLVELQQGLDNAIETLTLSDANLSKLITNENLTYQNSFAYFGLVGSYIEVLKEAPLESAHLQSKEIFKDHSAQLIEELQILQCQWVDMENELNATLYLDALPSDADIKAAITVLREGDSWYRIFQSKWRDAIKLHKLISKSKLKIPAAERLRHLENLIQLIPLKERWRSHPTWALVLNLPPPSEPYNFHDALSLSRWNIKIKSTSYAIGHQDLNYLKFDVDGIRVLQRAFAGADSDVKNAFIAKLHFDQILTRLQEFSGMDVVSKLLAKVQLFSFNLDDQIKFIKSVSNDTSNLDDVIMGCEAVLEQIKILSEIDGDKNAQDFLGSYFKGVDTNIVSILKALDFAQVVNQKVMQDSVKAKLFSGDISGSANVINDITTNLNQDLQTLDEFVASLNKYGSMDVEQWTYSNKFDDLMFFSESLIKKLNISINESDKLPAWSLYIGTRKEIINSDLSDFLKLLEDQEIKSDELSDAYAYSVYSTLVKNIFTKVPRLNRFSGVRHSQVKEDFKELDKQIISLRGNAIGYASNRNANPQSGNGRGRVNELTEMSLLNYLIPQQRPRMPLRKILQNAGSSIQELKPCFMMGPQAVAQFLKPGAIEFDLVIMDEASQLKPEEAIGAIARGKQLVVVGDPNQLPPTSFFNASNQVSDDDDGFTTTDAESILDVCSSHFRPIRSLRWHYRSQHHSLIAFSNKNFYKNDLIVFPSPYEQGGSLGVRAIYLADAIYENQTNLREAKRVVDAVVEHIINKSDESLGVVTLNIKQRDLISELLADKLNSLSDSGAFKEHWLTEGEPLFVKTLENVQGDERDAIIISTTFGKPSGSSVVAQRFGPISQAGGWRRLNVLFTRAKKSVTLYTSMRPDDIPVSTTTPLGTQALRNYLEYARSGSLTVSEDTEMEPESDFEVSVIDMLRVRGFDVTPQLGVAGYRIDIAVKHPKIPGCYLAAIECDGATYHSAVSVRDRDRIRQEILESLGWRGRIWRIWSTDWFRSPRIEIEKLVSFLNQLSDTWRPEFSVGSSWVEEGVVSREEEVVVNTPIATAANLELEIERETVNTALIADVELLEIEVGDVVHYVDLKQPADVLTVQITDGRDDFENGIVNEGRPLARILLGATKGDEVTLHLTGANSRHLFIIEVIKSSN